MNNLILNSFGTLNLDYEGAEEREKELMMFTRNYLGGIKLTAIQIGKINSPSAWDDDLISRGYLADAAYCLQRKLICDEGESDVKVEQCVLLSRKYDPATILFRSWTNFSDTLRMMFGEMPWVGPINFAFGRGGLAIKRACDGALLLPRRSEFEY